MGRWTGVPGGKRPSNSDLNLDRIVDEEARRTPEEGIFELFPKPEEVPDEDAPLARDDDVEQRP
jgi:hypothetical protein